MRVTLQQWLQSRDIPIENGMAIALATDELSPSKGSIIGISFASMAVEPRAIYLRGAQPERNMSITGITPGHYSRRAISTLKAIQTVQELLDETDFFITYSYQNYFKPWMSAGIQPLVMVSEYPVLDLVAYAMLLDAGMGLHDTSGESLIDLCEIIDGNVAHIRSDGYSFASVYNRVVGKPLEEKNLERGKVAFEERAKHVLELYRELLLR